MGTSRVAKRALVAVLGWVVKKLYRAILLLRLYVFVLERDLARSETHGVDAAQRQIDEGTAWLDLCDSLRGLLDFVLSPPQLPPSQPSNATATPASPAPRRGQQEGREASGTSADEGSCANGGSGRECRLATGGDGSAALALDSLDRAEGLRYLTRVMRGGLEAFVDCWDPAWPVLRPLPYNVKLGADNPDNLYMYGTVSGAFEYRLYGKRGSVTYLSFGVYTGSRPGAGQGKPAHLDSSRLVTQLDGSFEIFLTREPRGPNWLPLHPDASRMVVRQTFLRRDLEVAADIAIERMPLLRAASSPPTEQPQPQQQRQRQENCNGTRGREGDVPAAAAAAVGALQGAAGAASVPMVDAAGREVKPPLTAGQVVAGLAGAAVFISGSVRQFQAWAAGFAARPNTLATLKHDVYAAAWADPAICFFHGYWRLGPQEVLLIQVTPPECPYWNFQVDNVWMESMDTTAHPETTVNKATVSYMPDGSICLVVAHTDPRVATNALIPASARASALATVSALGWGSGPASGLDAPHAGGLGAAEPANVGAEVRSGAAAGKGGDDGGGDGASASGAAGREPESLVSLLPAPLLAGVTWVSTAHHAHGTMGLRWVLAKKHPVPTCRVVPLGRPLAEAIQEAVVLPPTK